MALRLGLGVLGVFYVATGLWMIFAPADWYATIPGVAASGPMNLHFVVDIGLAFLASGLGLLVGTRPGPKAAAFTVAGAAWPGLHAVFHIWGWLAHGLPKAADALLIETVGVVAVAALALLLASLKAQKEGLI